MEDKEKDEVKQENTNTEEVKVEETNQENATNKDTKHKKVVKVLIKVLLVVLMIIFILVVCRIVKYSMENRENAKLTEDILNSVVQILPVGETTNRIVIDFERLKDINNEVVGYLKVNGTDIEYPIVKTTNNDFYMTHNLEKKYNSAGWAFVDYRNKLDGTDKNIIVYGHNRRDGSMFCSLKNVLSKAWEEKEENRDVTFIIESDEENTIYKVFSVYEIPEEDYYITTDFSKMDFGNFVSTIKARSKYNFNVEVNAEDNILTLSTCGATNNSRIVLHAKKLK